MNQGLLVKVVEVGLRSESNLKTKNIALSEEFITCDIVDSSVKFECREVFCSIVLK